FTSVFHREYNDLNLCDITRCFVDETPESRQLVFDVHDEDRAFVRVLLEEHGIAPDEYVACLQLGASEESKRWPESRFAELGRLLVEKRQARLLLVGVAEEAGLGEAFEKEAPGIASRLYGQTTIPQLAALLERANVLVTNDTGTMHIAAAVGCPVALVSVGYVHFRETGPYGPGHCAVEYRRPRLGSAERELVGADERGKVRAEQVLRAVDLVVEREGGLPQLEKDAELTDVDLFITGFAPDGCLEWYPVVRRPITAMDLCRIAYRAMWLNYLWDNPQREAEAQSIDCILRRYAAPPDNSVEVWEREEGKAFKGFSELAQKGSRITERLLDLLGREGSMRKAQELVAQLMALDEEMRVYGELHPSCRPLVRIARYERDNLEGADPHLLASRTLDIYRESCKRARLMRQKIERVAEAWERLLAAFRRDASR
ncbi:MAG TPA: hypothetical protein ENN80_15255, partial [Candidatus Hydrogenedentes bacterium]|nr:hypothetical protein [Candidatus Hydrogenedentota bacterium]